MPAVFGADEGDKRIMGFYIDIILRNSKTGEEKVVEFWSAVSSYSEAWREAVEKGLHNLSDLWSSEGDEKYWYLASLADTTRR